MKRESEIWKKSFPSAQNKDYDAELEALESQENLWTSMLEVDSADIFWMNTKGKGKKGTGAKGRYAGDRAG